MIYAPVIIPTLNRISHLKRCVESLQRNPYAIYTDLYIALDYPPSEEYKDGYFQIKEYLSAGITGFNSVNVLYREKNLGPITNAFTLIHETFEKYDRLIYSEDDNVFAPSFLEYMDSALEKYISHEDILAVYASAPKVKSCPAGKNDAFCTNFYTSYGVGMWKNKEERLDKGINRLYIENLCCDKKKIKRMKKTYPESICYLASILLRKEPLYQTVDGKVEPIDVVRTTHAVAENKYLLCSPIPLIKNMGYDGSGVHCAKEDNELTRTVLDEGMSNAVVFKECPDILEINKGLRINRIIPYLSAVIRIWIWRLIAKRKCY